MPDFYLSKKCVGTFFTQQNMQILYSAHIELAKLIAAELDLTIYEGVNVFECDGSSCIVNYVFDKKMCLNNESYI